MNKYRVLVACQLITPERGSQLWPEGSTIETSMNLDAMCEPDPDLARYAAPGDNVNRSAPGAGMGTNIDRRAPRAKLMKLPS